MIWLIAWVVVVVFFCLWFNSIKKIEKRVFKEEEDD